MAETNKTAVGQVLQVYASKTLAELQALNPECLGVATDADALVFNGRTVRGVSAEGLAYIEEKIIADKEDKAVLTLKVTADPAGTALVGSKSYTVDVTTTFDGVAVDAVEIPTLTYFFNGNSATSNTQEKLSKTATGTYSVTLDFDADSATYFTGTGKWLVAFSVSAEIPLGAGASLSVAKSTTSGGQYMYAPVIYFSGGVDNAAASDGAELAHYGDEGGDGIGTFTTSNIKDAKGFNFATQAGEYLFIAVPKFLGAVTGYTSGGYSYDLQKVADLTDVALSAVGENLSYTTYRTKYAMSDTDTLTLIFK